MRRLFSSMVVAAFAFILFSCGPDGPGGTYGTTNAGATTYYVSQSAINGYAVGNDSNTTGQAQNQSTPWLSITHALSAVASSGDIVVVNDGIYVEGSFLNITKSVEIDPQNPLATTIQSTGGVRILNMNGSPLILTLGALVLDGQNSTQWCLSSSGSAGTHTLNLNGTEFLNPTQSFITNGNYLNLNASNIILNATALSTSCAINVNALGPGNINVNGATVAVTMANNYTGSLDLMYFNAINSGATATVQNVTGSVSLASSDTGTSGLNGIVISGIDGAAIKNCNLNLSRNGSTATRIGGVYEVLPTSSLTANNAVVTNNRGINGLYGQYLILVGEDSAYTGSSLYHKAMNANITGNNMSGTTFGNSGSAVMHGVIYGNQGGGLIANNVTNQTYLGIILKGDTASFVTKNQCYNTTVSGMYAKGATNSIFDRNLVYGTTSTWRGLQATYDEPSGTGNISSGVTFSNNVVLATSAVGQFTWVGGTGDSSTASFTNNQYFSSADQELASPWSQFGSYGAANYSTFAAWQAAYEPTAKYQFNAFAPAGGGIGGW